MNDAPLVTILVATYNPGHFVNATIECALRQTFADFELIVVDDGSSDDTIARLRGCGDSRLRIIEQTNQGAPAALNAGLRQARGHYIALLDHDDLWKETKLARHVDFLERCPEVDGTFSWSRLVDESGREIGPHPARWQGYASFRQLLENTAMSTTSALVLRTSAMQAVAGFDPALPFYYDLDLILRMALLRPHNICAVGEELNFYRRHRMQTSRNWRPWHDEWHTLWEKLRRLSPEGTAAAEARAKCLRSCYFAYLAYKNGEFHPACRLPGEALTIAPRALVANPWHWKVAAACMTGLLLPATIHRRLERLAGIRRDSPHVG